MQVSAIIDGGYEAAATRLENAIVAIVAALTVCELLAFVFASSGPPIVDPNVFLSMLQSP